MTDKVINLNSQFAKKIGFTNDKFTSASYLWRKNDTIIISFIESIKKRQGYLNNLFDKIEKLGYRIAVPTPLGAMINILIKKGFKRTFYWDDRFRDNVEIWINKY